MKKSGKDALSIGIDLGTTCTCVGVWRQGRVKIIINKHCRITTPSCVGFGRSSIFVGDDAINTSMVDRTNLIFDAKRLLGKKFSDFQVQEDMKLWPFKVTQGDNDTPKIQVTYNDNIEHFAAEDISCIILGKMKELAESYMGETVGKAVITVPAYFNNAQREATKKAGTKAGLNVIRLINEPTAAAIAYVKQNKLVITENMNLLVFDLGGGTFDVSIATITEGGENIEVKAIAGDPHLGGVDFDNKMVEHCFEEFMRKHGKDLNVDMNVFGKLRCACELGKIHLSSVKLTEIYVDHFFEGKKFEMEFSRATFENLTSGLRERCIEKVMGCLSDANMSASCINRVLLVGGSTKIPSIQSALKNVFGENKLFMDVDVQEAVAIGATMMAAKLSPKDKAFQDFTLRDVTPLLLGIGVEGDVFDVVIPQNTSIPVKRSKKYTPTEDEQTSIDTIVNESERTHASNNHRLGTCTMTGISPAPKKARLSTDVIDKMKALADKFKVPGGCFKKASVELHSLIATMKDTTKSMPKGVQLNKIEDALSDTTKWLKEKKGASGDELQAKKKSLETIFMQNKVDGI